MKRKLTALLAALCITAVLPVHAGAVDLPLTSRAAVLMEKTTGQMLFAQNEHEKLEPASVTKIMTLLLTMDAIDSGALAYDDVVTVSANAAGMGGSQVWLAEGEQITVEELLKCVCVSSGNDAAVALAEKVAGVTELFVEQMNNRARGLGMDDTHFANPTGLTAAGHVTSAYDIALMSRELLTKHPDIRNFTTIWTDSIRNGTFDLANTNKLIRWYDGATGLKTGYTASAGYCISATAEREGMELIAVVMKGETSDKRNTDAKALLNYGFSAYTLVSAGAAARPAGDHGRGGAGGPDAAGDGRYRCGGEGAGIVAGVSGGPAGDAGGPDTAGPAGGHADPVQRRYGGADGAHSGGGERSGAQLGTDVHRSFEAGGVPGVAERGKAGESPVFPLVFSPETLYDRANSCIAPTRRF
mgnify:CR=1 FL=1